ncbi:helix-turn-helix domain-containing protein [Hymenobacter jeollabukensis]|uniref:Helix-turn-helix domain-containing protein n=1 Tax=Hymenobacter jeollabukensis TaxID=2025313 RepID=A0A5R8WMD6_9BACT|nr:helix-turn-helix domain-containing protein [Hymenobacter jeollabukensis]TLM90057.1 helix-turn-helix domain-containing protein [Hymenobacter jeollabukensis]
MQIPFTVLVLLLLAVVAQAVFAAGLLWVAPHNRRPNRLLALLMLAIALWILDGFFRVAGIYTQNANWYFAPIYYSFAFGPLLYFYVRSLTNHAFRLRPRHFWHFGPVALQAALYAALRLTSYPTRLWFWEHVHRPVTYRLEFIGTWVSLMVYLGLSLRLLRRYRRYLDDNFSETSQLRLRWLRTLLVLLAVVSAQWLVEVVLREFFDLYYRYDYSTDLLGVVVFCIGVVGLRQADMRAVHFRPETASAAEVVAGAEDSPTGSAPAVAGTGESAGAAAPPADSPVPGRPQPAVDARVQERVRRALEDEQLFRNPTLTLTELAAHTGLPARLLSFTINQGFGKSFNDLVNGYRVAEVQRRLARTTDAQRLTLLGIAFESGFNSKTTFNRIFKQVTGVAPSEWAGKEGRMNEENSPSS